jgi:hypothetical protein
MKPLEHAQKDVAAFGGVVEDYLPIHDFFDQTKAFIPDMRHRAVLHNAWGIFLCERVFGPSLTNKDGKVLAVRTIAERHVLQDLKFIPTFEQCFGALPFYDWLTGKNEGFRAIVMDALSRASDGGEEDDDA